MLCSSSSARRFSMLNSVDMTLDTPAAVSSSSDPTAYTGFGPFMPGFSSVKYNNLDEVRAEFEKDAAHIAAIMIEPIQGEAGGKSS